MFWRPHTGNIWRGTMLGPALIAFCLVSRIGAGNDGAIILPAQMHTELDPEVDHDTQWTDPALTILPLPQPDQTLVSRVKRGVVDNAAGAVFEVALPLLNKFNQFADRYGNLSKEELAKVSAELDRNAEEQPECLESLIKIPNTMTELSQSLLRNCQSIFNGVAKMKSKAGLSSNALAMLGPALLPMLDVSKFFRTKLSVRLSPQCADDMVTYLEGLQKGETWSKKYIDAMGKPGAGILTGAVRVWGDAKECYDSVHTSDNGHRFAGHMCMVTYHISAPKNLPILDLLINQGHNKQLGIQHFVCFPETCSTRDISLLSRDVSRTSKLRIPRTTVQCPIQTEPSRDPMFIITWLLLSVLTCLCVAGTVYDMYFYKSEEPQKTKVALAKSPLLISDSKGEMTENSIDDDDSEEVKKKKPLLHEVLIAKGKEFLLCFSVPMNMKLLLDTSVSDNDLGCLHGIRAITVTWVIFGHARMMLMVFIDNPASVFKWLSLDWTASVFGAATYSVDTFLFLSGFLNAYTFMKNKEVTLKNMLDYYWLRWWRLTPTLMVVMIFIIGVSPYLVFGQMGVVTPGFFQNRCSDFWWRHMIYINNLYRKGTFCMAWTWYLGVDTQIFVFAPIVLLPWVYKKHKIGALLTVAAIWSSIFATFGICYDGDLLGLEMHKQREYGYKVYRMPHCRMAVYFIGVLLGYIIRYYGKSIKLKKATAAFGWLAAFVTAWTLFYLFHVRFEKLYTDFETAWGNAGSSVYEALKRPIWALCCAWVVFACCTGNGSVINRFLSWRGWKPVSRLGYTTYLFHEVLLNVYFGSMQQLGYFNQYNEVLVTISISIFGFLSGIVLMCLIEYPSLHMLKMIKGVKVKK